MPDTWRRIDDTLQFWSGGADGNTTNGAFTAWRPGEPSQGDVEGCGRLNTLDNAWVWADAGCNDPYPYICEGPGN